MNFQNGLSITRQAVLVFKAIGFYKSMNEMIEVKNIDQQCKLSVNVVKRLADRETPVGIYLKLREHFDQSVLLESNDFRSAEDCHSLIAVDPIAGFLVKEQELSLTFPNRSVQKNSLNSGQSLSDQFQSFVAHFKFENESAAPIAPGFFGHTSFDGIQYFEQIQFAKEKRKMNQADMHYRLYRFVVMIDHFKDEMYLIEYCPDGEKSQLGRLEKLLNITQPSSLDEFKVIGEVGSNLNDQQFKDLVKKGKHHCQIGDVFQIVFARQFYQEYAGEEFQVYRVLRSINPSPYLFFFDYGDYKIFGSSPEAQLVIENGIAKVNPIAGTYRRTGNDEDDRKEAAALAKDPKENAEHIMLVDLARNDLGKHALDVHVSKLKEIQYFSHVIHLVSTVEGKLKEDYNPIQVFGDSFPAGTLSGAPKYKALQLINKYENQNRGFYGGGIGFVGCDGSMNQAIVIRSFLAHEGKLFFQAGAGIVVDSQEEKELQEVNHKLGALRKAILEAEKLRG